jgi:hypothetical protein
MDWRQLWCSRLERNALKKARSVLRGVRVSNNSFLPDKPSLNRIPMVFVQEGGVKMPYGKFGRQLKERTIKIQVPGYWMLTFPNALIISNTKHY